MLNNENHNAEELIEKIKEASREIDKLQIIDSEVLFIKRQFTFSVENVINSYDKMKQSKDSNEYYLLLCALSQTMSQSRFWLNKFITSNAFSDYNPIPAMVSLKHLYEGITFSLNVINYQNSIHL